MAVTQMNGYQPVVAEQHVQAAFYNQWLQLRDSVLADKHPRFKLPAAVRQRLQPLAESPSAPNYSSASQLPGLSNGSSREQSMLRSAQGAAATRLGNAQAFSQNTTTAVGTVAPRSGIDPVLLTKSDDLIRAEIQLKRQRIERQLKDAADQRKHTAHFKNQEEMAPLADLTETFEKALELVKPLSGLKVSANAQAAASDSFDENSYYSSQANDWSSQEGSPKKKAEASSASQQATGLASSVPLSQKYPAAIERHDKQHHPSVQAFDQHETEALYDAEREDSEEYSPPDANAFSGADGDADAMDLDDGKSHFHVFDMARLSVDTDSSEFVPQDAHIPSPQAPIVTNRLTRLAAPQPARVSPLALTKPPGLDHSQTSHPSATNNQQPASPHAYQSSSAYRQQFESDDSTTSPRNSTQTSPAGAFKKQRGKGKKRKREADIQALKARKNRPKHVAPSPEPYIKPEPVSPPPFAAPAILRPVRTRPYQLPSDVEIVSGPRPSYYQESAPPSMHYAIDGVPSPNDMRVSSPGVYARPRRDDQDLRRVASLHAAHRPASPMVRMSSPANFRTVSQPFPQGASRYGEGGLRTPQVQYMRSERSVTPPHLRAVREGHATIMAPPPPPPVRRIVMDQYGNRYYANDVEAHSRTSVAPQLRPEAEMMYERAPSRQSVVYASQPSHVYEDEHGLRMPPPPPPPPVRRVMEQTEGGPTDYRAYRQREYSRAPEAQYYRDEAAGPVYIREAPGPRASVYPPEANAGGAYAPRGYSVHPEMEAARYMSRQASMAPQADYVRVAETGGRAPTMAPPAAPMRAVSVVPGSEYGRPVEMRYSYGSQGAGSFAGAGQGYGEEGLAAPREIYVDQYGREVRRVGY
ncbi:hypothetical protein E4T43_07603 [Aureobasidium subglaciale]|nr:hypothetical protein E4T43_07603 [Aureobasidium subglaciale]